MKIILMLSLSALFFSTSYADMEDYYDLKTIDTFMNGDVTDGKLTHVVSEASERYFAPLGYKKGAKNALFGAVYLEEDNQGYFVRDVYCNKIIRRSVGPYKIPNNSKMNAEHTWPQSKGSKREPFRGDLHHLYPTDSKANSVRGNVIFAEVEGEDAHASCSASQVGRAINPESGAATGRRAYQPPEEHRGNVARALFYASVFYNYPISQTEEYYLKKWHLDDPVTDEDIIRNDFIEDAQGNRNPFVDYPELVERITDF